MWEKREKKRSALPISGVDSRKRPLKSFLYGLVDCIEELLALQGAQKSPAASQDFRD